MEIEAFSFCFYLIQVENWTAVAGRGPAGHARLKHFKVCQHLSHSPKALFSEWFQLVPRARRSQGVFRDVWARSSRKCSGLGEQSFGCCWGPRGPSCPHLNVPPKKMLLTFSLSLLSSASIVLSLLSLSVSRKGWKPHQWICWELAEHNSVKPSWVWMGPRCVLLFWGLCSSTSSISLILLLLWRKVGGRCNLSVAVEVQHRMPGTPGTAMGGWSCEGKRTRQKFLCWQLCVAGTAQTSPFPTCQGFSPGKLLVLQSPYAAIGLAERQNHRVN